MKTIKLFGQYARRYLPTALCFLAFTAVFAVVCALYDAPLDGVWYALALCLGIAAVAVGVHFTVYVTRAKARAQLKRYPESFDMDARTPEERDYLEVIADLRARSKARDERERAAKTELTDYFGLWVHQIKTPIAAMRLLLTDGDGAARVELFKIEQYVDMALGFLKTDDLVDKVFVPCRLDDCIRDAVRKLAPLFVGKKLKLVYEPTDAVAVTDAKWLTFILEQLLTNAVKYTARGQIEISVRGQTIEIADTGIGIPQEDLPRIFEKGYTGYNGRVERTSTGIGLYLAARAAKSLSHRLSVRSEVGVGSVFSVDTSGFEAVKE